MAMDNLNDEDKQHASTSLPQRSEQQGCNLLTNDSANIDGAASDCLHNDNVPRISQSHNWGIVPSGGNLTINSSQINNPSNFMPHYLHEGSHQNVSYLHEGDYQSLLHGPNSGFLYQHAPFNLNSSAMLGSGREAAVDNSSGGRPQVLNPIARSMDGNIGQPPCDFNFGMPMFSPNQGAVSLNSAEKLEQRHLTSNSGSNTNAEINTKLFGINLAGESKRGFVPPFSTHHSRMDSSRFLYPDFDMNGAISGFQNNNEVIYDLRQNADAWMQSTNNHNRRPGIRIGPPSLPSDSNQIMQRDINQSKASEQTVFSSPGMVSNQPLSRQLPEFNVNSNGNFSLQSSTSPLGTATGRTSRMDPSNLGMQTGMRNMIAQVSRPSDRSSLKRGASEPQSSLTQARQRKTLMNRPIIPPSVPTWTESAPLMPNTTQTSFPSNHTAMPLTRQSTVSTGHPPNSTWAKTALSAPNTSQTIPLSIHAAPFVPPQPYAVIPPPHYDERIPSSLPGSQIISRPQPQMTQSLPHMSSTPKAVPSSCIKRKDKTLKPIGHNCCLCKRDLSFAPEGPISQPSPPPTSAVLACGHAFHSDCLEKITPEDQAKDPPCIPCALGE